MPLCISCNAVEFDYSITGRSWQLKNSADMSKSATDGGCEGCQFFLALIEHHFAKRHPNTPRLFQDFVEQAKPVQIDKSYGNEQERLKFDECRASDNNQSRVEIELCEVIGKSHAYALMDTINCFD